MLISAQNKNKKHLLYYSDWEISSGGAVTNRVKAYNQEATKKHLLYYSDWETSSGGAVTNRVKAYNQEATKTPAILPRLGDKFRWCCNQSC